MLPISDDHLQWHQHFEHYVFSKMNIFKLKKQDIFIYPSYPTYFKTFRSMPSNNHTLSSDELKHTQFNIQLEGLHNQLNVLAAYKAIEK